MGDNSVDIDAILSGAVEVAAPEERAAYLREQCGCDEELLQRVEELVDAHFRAGDFLETAAVQFPPEFGSGVPEGPGIVIGPYKLLQQIGEGGMGVVFMAEQARPVQRTIALKIIKPGMDTRQVIARFEAERQALAMMDHPNIARVIDAGTTDTGRPYFVMDLVKGIPITDYCDGEQLTIRQRLELMTQVCHAVQHAHQKGIIHRDLKPSNVLVAEYDGVPVPKIIDFGVAKATAQRLTERTMFTEYGQLIGTFQYMSPEQARFNQLDVDTRSDIYSLGVLLYELLVGSTPLDRQHLQAVPFDETLRMIREIEPPIPSTRLSSSGSLPLAGRGREGRNDSATIAANRNTEPSKLLKEIRGELDWIVMKCLEKDRNRRYDTAAGLAADIERHLNDEPVQACPPSASYRIQKLVRRHLGAFIASTVAALGLLLAVATLAGSNMLIRQEQARTENEKIRAEQAQGLAEKRAEQNRRELERLKAANMLLDRGRWYASMRRWDDAYVTFTKALELRPDHVSAWIERGNHFAWLGLWDLAAADFAREFELSEPDTTLRWLNHALLCLHSGDSKGYQQLCRRMVDRFGGTPNHRLAAEMLRTLLLAPDADVDFPSSWLEAAEMLPESERTGYHLYIAGVANYRAARLEQAILRLNESQATNPDWASAEIANSILAMAHHRLGQAAEARQALLAAEQGLGRWTNERLENDPVFWAHHRGATAQWPVAWWDWIEGEYFYCEAKLLIDGTPPPADPRQHVLRARAFAGLRWPERAELEYEKALEVWPHDRQFQFEAHANRAQSFVNRARWKEAAKEFGRASELQPDVVYCLTGRAVALLAAGDADGYRETCATLIQRFEKTENSRTAGDVVEACVLRGDALAEMARLLPMAEVAVPEWHYGMYVRGAALYRAGRDEEAVQCFEAERRTFQARPWDWAFLAMAHARLGHGDEAHRCLAEAKAWIDEANQQQLDDLTGVRPAWGDWRERVIYPLLVREAQTVVHETAGPFKEPTSAVAPAAKP